MDDVYEAAEDSFMLQKHIKDYAKGRTLDIGTGSGIQAIEAAEYAKQIVAADINKKAINEAKKKRIKNIKFIHSDLFSKIKGKFDCIIFNPPYLPTEEMAKDIALDAGKKGYEIIVRFLEECRPHLENDGVILLLFSSLSRPEVILKKAEELLLDYKLVDQQHIFFEDLFVYEIRKSAILNEFESKKISGARIFTHGKHGEIFTGKLRGEKVAIKMALTSQFETHIQNEAKILRRINKLSIGPKFLFSTGSYFAYNFIEGDFILDFLGKATKAQARKVIRQILRQCRVLDQHGLSKFEMTKPVKHIIVQKNNNAIMIDFERCKHTKKPKNVTQFCQFLISPQVAGNDKMGMNRKQIIDACKNYKKTPKNTLFKKLEKIVFNQNIFNYF